MIVRKTYKFRLYHNRRNRHLHDTINCAGIAWNHITALQKRVHQLGHPYISKYALMKHMAKLRRRGGRFVYLKQIPSQALQELCERHDKTYQAFFNWHKKGGIKRLPPRFKKISRYKSYTLKQAGWRLLEGNKIRIGTYIFKYAKSRDVEGQIKTVTIKRDRLGRLWVCLSVLQEVARKSIASTGQIGGFDFSLRHFLVDHTGNKHINPTFFKQNMVEIARCNRALSRKVKGSTGWKRAKRDLAKAHERVANRRADFHWKLAHDLTDRYDVLRFEDLHLAAMKQLWGRQVSDLGLAQFLQIVAYLAQVKGKQVEQIDRWNPSSQCCHRCHHRQPMPLAKRMFSCDHCGLVIDRDHNAARNIQAGGASPVGVGDVSRALPAISV